MTVRVVLIAFALLMTWEVLAFTTTIAAPITWVMIDAGNATPLTALSWSLLAGHFWPPRPRWYLVRDPRTNADVLVPMDPWRRVVALSLCGAAAIVAYPLFLPAAAALAGYPVGALFFPSADRRERKDLVVALGARP